MALVRWLIRDDCSDVPERDGEGDGDGAGVGEGDTDGVRECVGVGDGDAEDHMEADAAGEAECGGVGLADSDIHTGTDGQAEGSGRARAALLVPARVAGPPRPGTIGPPTRLPRNRSTRYAGFT